MLAISIWAQTGPTDAIEHAAEALGRGDAAGFLAAFEPKTPGLAEIRAQVKQLVRYGSVQSTIQFGSPQGDTFPMQWELQIREELASQALVLRKAQVRCRMVRAGNEWRIAGFEPRNFFAMPHVDGAWNLFESATAALSQGDAAGFLSYFDRSMQGFQDVSRGVNSMVAQGVVNSSIEMTSNEGSDTSRTLQVDWTLHIDDFATGLLLASRQQLVTCRVDLQKDRWRIVGVQPVAFFAQFLLGANFAHNGDRRAVLHDGQVERNHRAGLDIIHLGIHGTQPRTELIGQIED